MRRSRRRRPPLAALLLLGIAVAPSASRAQDGESVRLLDGSRAASLLPTADPEAPEVQGTGVVYSLGSEGSRLTASGVLPVEDVLVGVAVSANDVDENGSVDLLDFDAGLATGVEVGVSLSALLGEAPDQAAHVTSYDRYCEALSLGEQDRCSDETVRSALRACERVATRSTEQRAACTRLAALLADDIDDDGLLAPQYPVLLSFGAGFAYQRLTWRAADAAFAAHEDDAVGPFGRVGASIALPAVQGSVTVSAEYRLILEAPPTHAVCVDGVGTGPFACVDRQFTAPVREGHRVRARAELRHFLDEHLGLAVRGTFEASEASDETQTTFDESGFRARSFELDVGVFFALGPIRLALRPSLRFWLFERAPVSQVSPGGSLSIGTAFRLL